MTKELERKIEKLEEENNSLQARVSELEGEWSHLATKYDVSIDRVVEELAKLTGHPEYYFR